MDKTIKKGFYDRDGETKHIDIYRRNDDFVKYIDRCQHRLFKFEFDDGSISWSPYINRWSPVYQKMVLAKFYQLKRYLDTNQFGYKLGMLTLNSYQDGYTDKEVLLRLNKGWDKLRQSVNKMGFDYIKLFEPHKSGVPHMHIGIIGDRHLTLSEINRLKNLWTIKYGISSPDKDKTKKYKNKWDCIGFGYTMADDTYFNQHKQTNDVSNLINYIISYMSKSVMANLKDISYIRFHSLFWSTGKRMWSTSADITKIMLFDKPEPPEDAPELLRILVVEAPIVKDIHGNELYCLIKDKKSVVIYDSDPLEINNVIKNIKALNDMDIDIYKMLISKYGIKNNKYVLNFYNAFKLDNDIINGLNLIPLDDIKDKHQITYIKTPNEHFLSASSRYLLNKPISQYQIDEDLYQNYINIDGSPISYQHFILIFKPD